MSSFYDTFAKLLADHPAPDQRLNEAMADPHFGVPQHMRPENRFKCQGGSCESEFHREL
jgi:hypothetical protein